MSKNDLKKESERIRKLYDSYSTVEKIGNHIIKTFESDKPINKVEVIDLQIGEQLRAIGTFVYKFSQLEFMIRHELFSCLELTEDYFNLLVSPYDFAMLCKVAREVFIKKHPTKNSEISEAFGACLALNGESRIRIAHALWAPHSDLLAARHVSRETLKPRTYFVDPEELYTITEKTHTIMAKIYLILHENIHDYLHKINAKIVHIEAQFEEGNGIQKPIWEVKVRKIKTDN